MAKSSSSKSTSKLSSSNSSHKSSLTQSSKIFIIIVSIIGLALLCATYHYLTKLESCACIHGTKIGENISVADIEKLRYIELFFIVIAVIGLINIFVGYQLQNKMLVSILSVVYSLLLIVIYVFLVIHVLRLYKNMPNDCECALKWPRYYLYIQAFISAIALFFILLAIIVSIFVFAKMTTMKK